MLYSRVAQLVEQEAVNFEVAGSSPAPGAKHKHFEIGAFLFCYTYGMSEITDPNAPTDLQPAPSDGPVPAQPENKEQHYAGQFEVSVDQDIVTHSELPEEMKSWLARLPDKLSFDEPVTLIVGPNGGGKTQFARALIEAIATFRNTHIDEGQAPHRQTTGFDEDSPAARLLPALQVQAPHTENRGAFPTDLDGTAIMHETKLWASHQALGVKMGKNDLDLHRKSSRQLFQQTLESIKTRSIDRMKEYKNGTPTEYPDALVVLDEPEQGLDPDGQLGLPETITSFLDETDTLLVPTNNIVLARTSDLPRLDLSHPERGIHRPSDYGELLALSPQQ